MYIFFQKLFKGSLKNKIFFGYIGITFITFILTILSISNLINLKSAINNIMLENYRSVVAAEEMMDSLERQDSGELIYLFHQRQEGEKIFRDNQVEFVKWLGRAEDNITISGEGVLIEEIEENYQNYIMLYEQLRDMLSDDLNGAQDFYFREISPQFELLKSKARNLLLMNQDNMYDAQQKANNNTSETVYSTLIFSIGAILLAGLFGLYISNQIIKPIRSLTQHAVKVGEGGLDTTILIESEDEIGKLAEEFNRMTEKMRKYGELNVQKLISEKQKSEGIVRSISSPLLVTDAEHRIVLANPASEELFDFKEEKAIGKHVLEVIKDERIFKLINAIIEGEEDKNLRTTLPIEKNQTTLHYQGSVVPVFGQDGDIKLIVTIFDDITKLKELDSLKSEFVSTVSHEFRTPLTSMNMSIGMLLGNKFGELNEKQTKLLSAAKEDCERLKNLVSDLLDLSKIESGKIEMEFKSHPVRALMEASIKTFEELASDKEIELMIDVEEDLMVYADANKIIWVLTNLLGNALRYTTGGGKISVNAEAKGSRVYVSVKDTGKGIPLEYQNKIFEKFVRVYSDEEDPGGTGLGLAISREIVEAHGGKIWVTSQPGKGSTFTFTLRKQDK